MFFSVLLFWLLELPPIWATTYTAALIVLCWLPVRYPITSLITTHWKPGFESITNYLAMIAVVAALIQLRDAPSLLYWPVLIAVVFQLIGAPALMAAGVLRPGFRRVY